MNTRNTMYLHTIQGLDLLKTRESHFSFVWDMDLSIISPCFDEANVSTVNSDLANVCTKTLNELCVSNGV